MISVDEARSILLTDAKPLSAERVPLIDLVGRIAAEDIHACMMQPPFAASAMDGYAVQFADMEMGAVLNVIGEAPAGAPFGGEVRAGQAVRIFTGGAIPTGADHVIIQEDIERDGDVITVSAAQSAPANIRAAGIDFKNGDVIVAAGERLHEIHGSLLAAANIAEASVVRRPKVAIFSNGDELREPGDVLNPGEIINSNHYALRALVTTWGGDAQYLGCASDDVSAIEACFHEAKGADIIVPVGGASVGDYDYVKSVCASLGGDMIFEKIAVRPGKPTWFAKMGETRVLGLPGNPASAIVTAALFLQPLVRALGGQASALVERQAILECDVNPNGGRESYLRARTYHDEHGALIVEPAGSQDSSLLSPFAACYALIKRSVKAPAAASGESVDIVLLR